MLHRRKFLGVTMAGGLAAPALLRSRAALAQTTVRVAAFVPEQSFGVSKVIKPWMAAVEKEVGDQVRMQGFWGGTLGKDPFKQFELVRNGVADVVWVLPGYTPGQFAEMQMFELPFLFTDATEAGVTGWRLHERGALTGFDGVEAITIFATEPSNLWMREPISTLEGLANKKVRSPGAVHARWLESWGASPETMDSPVMNEMLNRGTLDGVIQGSTGMKTYKSLPLVEQAHLVPLGVIPFLLLVNAGTWGRLPEAVKETMMKHGGEALARRAGEAYEAAGQEIRAEIKEEGRIEIVEPSTADIERYQARTAPVHSWWIEKTDGGAVYDLAKSIRDQVRGGA